LDRQEDEMTTTTLRSTGVDDLGTGEPALLLMPGWCGDRTVFDSLSGLLADARRTLVTDLRGQGGLAAGPGASVADFGSSDQVDDLVATLDARGIDRVVPVALAHAGWFAVELRRRLGSDRVPGLVLVDWMPLGTPPGFAEALSGLQDPAQWQDVRAALTQLWVTGVDEPAVHDYVATMTTYGFEHWSRAGREIAAGFAQGSPLAVLAELGGCPTLHLYAQPRDPAYLSLQQEFSRLHPWFHVRQLDAASHFPMLEVPGTMAREIEEFACSLG
jgi:pimeloyl-ACP methyl ester carboxylesterase